MKREQPLNCIFPASVGSVFHSVSVLRLGKGKHSHTQQLMGSSRVWLDLSRQALQSSPWKHITHGTGMIGREERVCVWGRGDMGLRGGYFLNLLWL